MTSRFLFASAMKDLSRWWRDAPSILLWLGIPFLIGGLITIMMDGGDGNAPTGVLLVADQDDSLLSGLIVGAYSQDQLGDLISVRAVDVDEGDALMNAGEASAFLTLPEGFQDAFLNETPVTLTLKTNPSQTILPGIIEDVTEVLLDAGFYAQQLLGDEFARIQDSQSENVPDELFVAEVAVDIRNRIDSVAPKLFPPIIDLEIVEPPPAEPRPDIALLFLPGIVLMAILFSANSLANDYWLERDNGTLRRLVSAPGALLPFVAGKAMAVLMMVTFVAAITLLAGFLYHGISWWRFVPSLIWVAVGGVGLFAWFSALQMMFPNSKAANVLSLIVVFPLLMAGGSFFPLAALPDWIAAMGRLSPNGFVADRLTVEFTAAHAWAISARDWLVAFLIALSGLGVSSWRLKAGFARA